MPFFLLWATSVAITIQAQDPRVIVKPKEFNGAINNPLKGFRDYHRDGFGLLEREYIGWNSIEWSAHDTVERIIAHTNAMARKGT